MRPSCKYILLFVFCFGIFFSPGSFAQSWEWAKGADHNLEDNYALSVATDNHGNVYTAGYFDNSYMSLSGDTLWNASFYYPTASPYDMFLAKYDAIGNVLWAKSAVGKGNEQANSIATDPTGNVFVTGYFTSDTLIFGADTLTLSGRGLFAKAMFLVKYDALGNVLWARTAYAADTAIVDGVRVTTDATGNVFVTGIFQSRALYFGADTLKTIDGGQYLFTVKYDSLGNVLWARQSFNYGGSAYAGGIATDAAGCVYVAGEFSDVIISFGLDTLVSNSAPNYNLFLVKYDISGNVVWTKTTGGTGPSDGAAITVDVSGNLIIAGSFAGNIILGADTLNNSTTTPLDAQNLFIAKGDTSGNFAWAKSTGGNSWSTSLQSDAMGDIYLSGGFTSASTSTYGLTNRGGSDILVAGYNTVGDLIAATSIGNGGNDVASAITLDNAGHMYMTGYFDAVLSSSLSFGSILFPGYGYTDLFLAKYDFTSSGVLSVDNPVQGFVAYPNPLTGQQALSVTFNAGQFNNMAVYNSLGQQVYSCAVSVLETSKQINLPQLTSGIYCIEATGTATKASITFVINN